MKAILNKSHQTPLPDHYADRNDPIRRCLCGCGSIVPYKNSVYASRDCYRKHQNLGRYRDVAAQLAGRPY